MFTPNSSLLREDCAEYFKKCGKYLQISDKNKTVSCSGDSNGSTAYGSYHVFSDDQSYIYEWKFKINGINKDGQICIGLVDIKQDRLKKTFQSDYHHPLYALEMNANSQTVVYKEFNAGKKKQLLIKAADVVTMTLNMKKRAIIFKINDEEYIIYVDSIKSNKNLQYKFAVTLKGRGTGLTLMDFSVTNLDATYEKEWDNYHREHGQCIEDEKMTYFRVDKQMEQMVTDLERQLNKFKQRYNVYTLQQIMDNTPNDLRQKHSCLHKQLEVYKQNTSKIQDLCQGFSKHIQDVDGMMQAFAAMDIADYESWNIQQILNWIRRLENGRFSKHIDQLNEGFTKDNITGKDLPILTRIDLANPPFNIVGLRDKADLAKHFQSLANVKKYKQPHKQEGDKIDDDKEEEGLSNRASTYH